MFADLNRLREWIVGLHDPAECLALIEAAAAGRPCPHCGCARMHRGGVASHRGIGDEHDCILVARDRNGQTLDFHTGRGPVTATQLGDCLQRDGAAAYRRFAAGAGIMHEAVNVRAGQRARGAIHVQNVNGWHSRFKTRLLDARELHTPALWLRAAVRQA